MKLNPHFKYLRFIFFFYSFMGMVGIFDFVNFYFDWNKPLINYNLNADVNSLNLRGSEILPEKTEGEIRILTLGDSVTYGVGFNANKSWPYQMQVYLEKMGIDATSMNAGKPSFTNEQMFIAYENLIKKGQKPDIVILYASGNLINLYGIQESYFGESKSFLKKIIPNFPNDLKLKEVENKEENFNHNKPLSLPLIIKHMNI
ncbi:MAG: hypothetical protein IPH52_17955 [Leptospiraceae bacterium]|nr:hypothetical protein [Leptospiraceae bacterium]